MTVACDAITAACIGLGRAAGQDYEAQTSLLVLWRGNIALM